jgi:hypothetical protein
MTDSTADRPALNQITNLPDVQEAIAAQLFAWLEYGDDDQLDPSLYGSREKMALHLIELLFETARWHAK